MKVLFAAALLSVIEAAELESYHTRHARLARAGIFGYGAPSLSPSIPAPYNTNRSGYFADHSDRSDDDSTN